MSWASHYIETNHIKLHYHRTGGDKPVLVLSHGITDSGLCWTRLVRALEADYDLIMVDARGHGLSARPESGYGTSDHAADLAGLVRALSLQQPALLGHSMGAATVASFGAAYPELAGRLLLEDPPWRPVNDQSTAEERKARMAEWRKSSIARQQQSHAEIMAAGRTRSPTWDEVEFAPWAEAKLQVSPHVFGFRSSTAWSELIPNIQSPIALITGDPNLGAIINAEMARDAAAANDKIQVIKIPGAGHNLRRDQFDKYLQAVRAFLTA